MTKSERRELRAHKRAVVARLHRQAALEIEQRRLERRCFWTWPFGHLWKSTNVDWHCRVCGKARAYAGVL